MNGQSASEDGQIITSLDVDDTEKKGFDLGATGRLALMAKLAQGSIYSITHVTLFAIFYIF